MFNWIKDKWTNFEAWVYSWLPGFKTKLAAGIGAVGSAAIMLQDFVTQMPANKFVTETQLAMATLVLFVLTFWFKRLSDKYST